jgi:hypothetical protein
MVLIGQVLGQEEDHVVAVAKRHELQTPKQIIVANGSGRSGSAIQKNGEKTMLTRSVPYLARQLSIFGPAGS